MKGGGGGEVGLPGKILFSTFNPRTIFWSFSGLVLLGQFQPLQQNTFVLTIFISCFINIEIDFLLKNSEQSPFIVHVHFPCQVSAHEKL